MNAWFPPGADPVEQAALVPGIPVWIDKPVADWVGQNITGVYGEMTLQFLTEWDVAMRNDPPVARRMEDQRPEMLWHSLDENDQVALVDFVLFTSARAQSKNEKESLEGILRAGGSEWSVGKRAGQVGLEKRVPQGVADAAEAVMGTASTAGALLSEAWHAAFGRGPDPEEAYEKAIKAVEEAGAGVVSPKNVRASLGTMARDMESQGNWSLPLGEDSKHPSASAPYMMVQALWAGQESRHGGNSYRKPTPEEAEAAVLLAVPLVQWFTSAVLARR
ncbi:hypothetical protein IWX81_002583 [Salinibacterium sp. CAN_S4]|uniref:hypothetical protein n=1 Tax=Salinibacterium sp. CAN_S4 TaxID=2787727 RepID=UPI0018EF772B